MLDNDAELSASSSRTCALATGRLDIASWVVDYFQSLFSETRATIFQISKPRFLTNKRLGESLLAHCKSRNRPQTGTLLRA